MTRHDRTGPLLSLRGVTKRFGAVRAITDIELDVGAGEILALMGQGGSGRSTVVNVVSGVAPADRGVIRWEGREATIRRPRDAQRLGIATVHQDSALCDHLNVVGNVFLGRELRRGPLLDEAAMGQRVHELLDRLGLPLPNMRARVGSLPGSQRQTVAIARALLEEPRLLLLDEPTAGLSARQAVRFLDLVEKLRDRGVAILLVSDNLGDVKAVADRVEVLLLGRNNGSFDVGTATQEQLYSAMTGATDNTRLRRPADPAGAGR
ncbi:ATP-binding cassette domain-containing protein [Streptomyces sp. URMC 129]|uniref:ATP-binding cassette domain-containing protein n=1 Tax=Streptomyces sp. URMC 129 TaxID=3423407 RepID=UPI003F1C6519